MIDWKTILNKHRIPFQESGSNVSKDHIAVRCPFCGTADPSMHMAISLTGKGWKCWRNHTHKGKSPVKLLASLLRISFEDAGALLGPKYKPLPNSVTNRVRQYLTKTKDEAPQVYELPSEFKSFKAGLPSAKFFIAYMEGRGFKRDDILRLTSDYEMYYATTGKFHGRIIFTAYEDKNLVGWTGRAIEPTEALRYRSEGRLSNHLLWENTLRKPYASILILCEGPMDALKVNVLGRKYGILATCFFTSGPSMSQINKLYQLAPKFEHVYLMLDRGEVSNMVRFGQKLSGLGVRPLWLPKEYKDPGELSKGALLDLVGRS